jgi:chaperonin GroEL (HSP60 family)
MSDEKIDPLHNNIRAARAIVNTVRTTLGPRGRDKMMVDAAGNTLITNDGATILREIEAAHPAAKMIIDISKTQDSLCYDGTTSAVVLAGQMLFDSENLFSKGVHPTIVCDGYIKAAKIAVDYLESELSYEATEEDLIKVAQTAISGKTLASAKDIVSQLCVESVKIAGNAEKVSVLTYPGGSLTDSYMFTGVVVNKDYVVEMDMPEQTQAVLLMSGLTKDDKDDRQQQISISNLDDYEKIVGRGSRVLTNNAKKIQELLPEGGILFCRDNVEDSVVAYLNKHDIAVVKRMQESTLRGLSSTLGVRVSHDVDDLESSKPCTVNREKHNDVYYLFVKGEAQSTQSTLIVRGASHTTLEEVERGFDDALGVVSLVLNGGNIVAGGGSAYAAIASHLRTEAPKVKGMEQMAINSFADTLEIIPATIGEVAGHTPLKCVFALRNAIAEGNLTYGPDVENINEVVDMKEIGVVEPTQLLKQAILSATEVTTAILKIDDIVVKRGE